jgi:hypothetical protein
MIFPLFVEIVVFARATASSESTQVNIET